MQHLSDLIINHRKAIIDKIQIQLIESIKHDQSIQFYIQNEFPSVIKKKKPSIYNHFIIHQTKQYQQKYPNLTWKECWKRAALKWTNLTPHQKITWKADRTKKQIPLIPPSRPLPFDSDDDQA